MFAWFFALFHPVVVALLAGLAILKVFIFSDKKKSLPSIPFRKKPFGVLVGPEVPGFGKALYNSEASGKLINKAHGNCKTIYEIVENSFRSHGPKRVVGQREILSKSFEEGPNGKKFEKLNLSPEYKWLTYNEYKGRVRSFASGMVRFANLKPKDKIVIYAETQVDWMVACFAAFTNNLTVVTIYATLGEDGAMHGINQTQAKLVVCDAKLLSLVQKIAPECPALSHVIVLDKAGKSTDSKLKVASIDDILLDGKNNILAPVPPQPSDLAVVMYTSGTTGAPKGVMLTHENITATVGGCQAHFHDFLGDDVCLAYLPLAHIMELCLEITIFSLGLKMGYGNPHTLTDNGVKLQRGCRGDATVLRPTFMVFAPAVLDKVYTAVQAKVKAGSPFSKKLFDFALQRGFESREKGAIVPPWYCSLIFKKVQSVVGGRVRVMCTGSAPLSPEIQKFIQTVFCCPVIQGYGLTETCAASFLGVVCDTKNSQVGPPTKATMIRLADWEEGNYKNSDAADPKIGMPRGEVLIGGPTVTQGYWVDQTNPDHEVEEKNKSDFCEVDGVRYFHTGDIGQITKDGTLQIIDRKKDLFKGPQGEYVSLAKVENAIKLSPFVDMALVYGKTGSSYIICLICPIEKEIRALAATLGIEKTDLAALCDDPKIRKAVSDDCLERCKKQRLIEFETPKRIALVVADGGGSAWTPENDLLTAALKLRRPKIVQYHKDLIDKLYA
eukprot:c6458_g1_i1.p1 GENE.c6458_g1_i1~~c6458_g1_i1.p1  ORF type:complete len:738 (+),score=165.86 c6458_g1_i1:41-2215(+)